MIQINPLQHYWLQELGLNKQSLKFFANTNRTLIAPIAMASEVLSDQAVQVDDLTKTIQKPITKKNTIQIQAVLADSVQASLDTMREQVVSCKACGLCQGRRHAVFGEGVLNAQWMIIGEAPGEQEDRQARPFVGRSGQLLDEMLRAVGMDRQKNVFIANVIKCRPPSNRNPKPEEIAACSPYLLQQIALIKPKRILVLGRFAAQTLLNTEATIGHLRGRIHSFKLDQQDDKTIDLIVSYHPAYLLRNPVDKARAWQDLQLAVGK